MRANKWIVVVFGLLGCSVFRSFNDFKLAELPDGEGKQIFYSECSRCHSLKRALVSKRSKQGWIDMIKYMQTEKGMVILDQKSNDKLVSYLSINFGLELKK